VTSWFDLNVEEVLEHWPVSFAIRELIANALDEQAITGTADPLIRKEGPGRWVIRDHGRGLRYQHLTQNENAEKRDHPTVIGQFGMGLKDALAVFHRRGVEVAISSPHGDITTALRPKEGFPDLSTLHAAVRPSSRPAEPGTRITLHGVSDEDVAAAQRYFLRYSGDRLLEQTRYGQVLARPDDGPGNLYVKGLLVAREENFLFSYNITSLTKPLRQALNRERSNVGRTAYADRVKAILVECRSAEVARPLADDLEHYRTGGMHDELAWSDVRVHACRVLAGHERVVFVTGHQLTFGGPQVEYAREEGYRLVLVPDDLAARIAGQVDLAGRPMLDLNAYREAWNEGFSFQFVEPDELTPAEAEVFGLTDKIIELGGFDLEQLGVEQIRISETMRLAEPGRMIVGLWDPAAGRIVIRRDRLATPAGYCGDLLHELVHAESGHTDGTLDFEDALTERLGAIMAELVTTP